MSTVNWSPDMRLGIPRLDRAHEAFMRELERLREIPDAHFGPAFHSMVVRMEGDFQEEEALMEDIDFPGLHVHREQHARVLGALHHVAARVMGGDYASGREATDLLEQWFLMHLSTMDTVLALTLEVIEAERAESLSADRSL
ncbi:MAG TPA: hemerythrin domain-containing protein [Noviherbaspirillum sp.]|nr:hemerythrin domain-containing protein [Noviherbaspirillum sp.]